MAIFLFLQKACWCNTKTQRLFKLEDYDGLKRVRRTYPCCSPPAAQNTRVFTFCSPPCWLCNRGQRYVTLTALVVLCKAQSRGSAMTPNMGEAWGTARVFAYLCNVLIISCAFQTRSVPSFAEFSKGRLTAQHLETKNCNLFHGFTFRCFPSEWQYVNNRWRSWDCVINIKMFLHIANFLSLAYLHHYATHFHSKDRGEVLKAVFCGFLWICCIQFRVITLAKVAKQMFFLFFFVAELVCFRRLKDVEFSEVRLALFGWSDQGVGELAQLFTVWVFSSRFCVCDGVRACACACMRVVGSEAEAFFPNDFTDHSDELICVSRGFVYYRPSLPTN